MFRCASPAGASAGRVQQRAASRRGSVFFFCALILAAPAVAGPLQDASAAYVRRDYTTALRLYRSLADQGDAIAQFALGMMYDQGQGVLQDYVEAAKWYRKAADQGNLDAQFDLGFDYQEGEGVPQDYVQAHMWFNLVAAAETEAGRRDLAVNARNNVAAKMTPAQIAEAQKLAREWKPKTN